MHDALPVCWLVGCDKLAAREWQSLLQRSQQLDVRVVPPLPRVEDYADLTVGGEAAAVLICASVVTQVEQVYSGATIADYLRALHPDLPIFLLDDGGSGEPDSASVDAVIAGDDLRDRPGVHSSRLLRAAGRYGAALSARQFRLQQLLDRQIAGTLDDAEAAELATLRADVERPAAVKAAKRAELHDVDLLEKRDLVDQLAALAEKLLPRPGGHK
jgi:hypothetical protein